MATYVGGEDGDVGVVLQERTTMSALVALGTPGGFLRRVGRCCHSTSQQRGAVRRKRDAWVIGGCRRSETHLHLERRQNVIACEYTMQAGLKEGPGTRAAAMVKWPCGMWIHALQVDRHPGTTAMVIGFARHVGRCSSICYLHLGAVTPDAGGHVARYTAVATNSEVRSGEAVNADLLAWFWWVTCCGGRAGKRSRACKRQRTAAVPAPPAPPADLFVAQPRRWPLTSAVRRLLKVRTASACPSLRVRGK